jgi:integrase
MPSLRKKSDGRWYIDYTEGGQRKRITISHNGKPIRNKFEAQAFYEHWNADRGDALDDPDSPRLSRVLDYYRDVHLPATNAASATRSAAATHCEVFTGWCRSENIGRCQQLSREVLTRWSAYLQKERSARTARNYLTTIRTAINVAVDAEILEKSPVRGRWVLPKVDDVERHPLTMAELHEIREIFEDMPIVQWICFTGNRPSDARSLRFRDVDIASQTVDRRSIKARSLRKYEVCAAAVAIVTEEGRRKHKAADIVFRNTHHRPWSADGLLNSFKARLRKAEYHRNLNLRDLRHTFGTIMANDVGVPLPELQILMGHTEIKTTMQYVRATGARGHLNEWDTRWNH